MWPLPPGRRKRLPPPPPPHGKPLESHLFNNTVYTLLNNIETLHVVPAQWSVVTLVSLPQCASTAFRSRSLESVVEEKIATSCCGFWLWEVLNETRQLYLHGKYKSKPEWNSLCLYHGSAYILCLVTCLYPTIRPGAVRFSFMNDNDIWSMSGALNCFLSRIPNITCTDFEDFGTAIWRHILCCV